MQRLARPQPSDLAKDEAAEPKAVANRIDLFSRCVLHFRPA